jgi:hypothetical protein
MPHLKGTFPGQRKSEKVVFLLRAHWLELAWHTIVTFVLAVMPIIAYGVKDIVAPDIASSSFFPMIILGFSAYYLFLLVYFYVGWLDYYLDVWIVTTERIINIVQDGMFQRRVSELNMYSIQDVTSEVRGIVQTFFKYGDVIVQTAGTHTHFRFHKIPNPYQVKRVIIKIHNHLVTQGYTPSVGGVQQASSQPAAHIISEDGDSKEDAK